MQLQNDVREWIGLGMNVLLLVGFVAVTVLGLWRLHRARKGAQAGELTKLDRVRGALQSLLQGSVFGLVTQAEQVYGSGNGAIKKSAVLAELLKLLPENYRSLFDAETLGAIIEDGVARAKGIWEKTES
jgi:hypothetical protein